VFEGADRLPLDVVALVFRPVEQAGVSTIWYRTWSRSKCPIWTPFVVNGYSAIWFDARVTRLTNDDLPTLG